MIAGDHDVRAAIVGPDDIVDPVFGREVKKVGIRGPEISAAGHGVPIEPSLGPPAAGVVDPVVAIGIVVVSGVNRQIGPIRPD